MPAWHRGLGFFTWTRPISYLACATLPHRRYGPSARSRRADVRPALLREVTGCLAASAGEPLSSGRTSLVVTALSSVPSDGHDRKGFRAGRLTVCWTRPHRALSSSPLQILLQARLSLGGNRINLGTGIAPHCSTSARTWTASVLWGLVRLRHRAGPARPASADEPSDVIDHIRRRVRTNRTSSQATIAVVNLSDPLARREAYSTQTGDSKSPGMRRMRFPQARCRIFRQTRPRRLQRKLRDTGLSAR
jgi:hypothetical protein